MVIWLEDLHEDDDRSGMDPVHEAEDDRSGGDVGDDQPETSGDDQVIDVTDESVTDDTEEPAEPDTKAGKRDTEAKKAKAAAAKADDEGWSLLDLEAARFTRH